MPSPFESSPNVHTAADFARLPLTSKARACFKNPGQRERFKKYTTVGS
jgi:hypothetical protein